MLAIPKATLVRLSQQAESDFVGVHRGIMDQFINIFGEDGRALKIDCRTLDYEPIPFESSELSIVLCETETTRSLAASAYNLRRKECQTGVEILRKHDPAIRSLRDVSIGLVESHRNEYDPVAFRRCQYVVRENERVHAACAALEWGDVRAFGQTPYDTHARLRDDYEVSSTELDLLVECATSIDGVLGARMMGASFGGCTINIVEDWAVDRFTADTRRRFRQKSSGSIKVHVTSIQAGTSTISGVPTYV